MFQTKRARRVTILVDAALKSLVIDKILELGATGYNYMACNGQGVHAVTGDGYSGENLLRIEVVTTEAVAAAILDFIHAAQFAQYGNYALSAYADHVEVDLRDRSFATPDEP